MKKNISINISGIIFHIEEDGYERLKRYLDGINQYFSSFDESKEIISDIESRIAEIFLGKLNEGKQVIVAEDVQVLIETMGDVKDFREVEDEVMGAPEEEPQAESATAAAPSQNQLRRDLNRKVIGGVCAGIAHYFRIDPLWIRLIFIIFLFDFFVSLSIGPIVLIAYIVLWIALPPSRDLKEDTKIKKLYRNPDDKVLGGVAGGIAAYFGVETGVIRLIFVIATLFGFSGLITYIILWIIVPEARTITEKVQMKGDPVTLENIETSIKSSFKIKEGEESTFVKILLFPFRVLADVIQWLGRALGPILLFLVDALRILAGIVVALIGASLAFGPVIFLSIAVGITIPDPMIRDTVIPLEVIRNSLPVWPLIALIINMLTIAVALILAGISIIARKIVGKAMVWWSILALWLVSSIALAITVPLTVNEFRQEGGFERTEYINFNAYPVSIEVSEIEGTIFDQPELTMRGYEGDQWKLVMNYEARGDSREDAEQNARYIQYQYAVNDSSLVFNEYFQLVDSASFRVQGLKIMLYVPYQDTFRLAPSTISILRHTLYPHDYGTEHVKSGNLWTYTKDGLTCINCTQERRNRRTTGYREKLDSIGSLVVMGNVSIILEESEVSELSFRNQKDLAEYMEYDPERYELVISNTDKGDLNVKLKSPHVPEIKTLGNVSMRGEIDQETPLILESGDNSKINLRLDLNRLELTADDDARITLSGSVYSFLANLEDNCVMDAEAFEAEMVDIFCEDNVRVKIFAKEQLEATAEDNSSITYYGTPAIKKLETDPSSRIEER